MLSGEVEQHDPEQDREQSLTGNARNRQDNPECNQQSSENVFANELRGMKRRVRSRPELRLMTLAKVVCGNLDQNE